MRRRGQLGRLREVGAGACGVVYAVEDSPVPLAYKEFTVDADGSARAAARAVGFRTGLARPERVVLDEYFAWPRELVTDHGVVRGFLMPLLTPDYYVTTRAGDPEQRTLKWLGSTRQQLRAAGVDLEQLTHTERLETLARLAYALAFLHRHGWVFGDVSARNAVFRIRPGGLLMVDCDGAAPLDDPARSQGNTPMWEPPEVADGRSHLQDAATDVFKLGLAIVRYLVPGTGSGSAVSPERVAERLDDDGVALLTRALSHEPADRPSARELYAYLAAAVDDRARPPRIERLAPAATIALAGRELWLDWRVRGADHLTVRVPGRRPARVSLARHPGGVAVRPTESGPVRVEARNAFGTAWAQTVDVDVWTPPPLTFDHSYLPRPATPELPAATLPALPTVPVDLTAGVARIPAMAVDLVAAAPSPLRHALADVDAWSALAGERSPFTRPGGGPR